MDKLLLHQYATADYNRQSYSKVLTELEKQLNRAADGYLNPVRRITTSDSMTLNDTIVLVDATAGNVTFTLQAALQWEQKRLVIKKIDASANTVTIDGYSTETIDGATTKVLSAQYASYELTSQGGAVWII